jgi:hypothetical protein
MVGTMAFLKIPDAALPDLKKIAELEEPLFKSLLSVASETPPTLKPYQFERLIAPKLESIPRDYLRAILGTVFFLYTLKEREQISSPKELSAAVINSSTVSKSEELSPASRERLKQRLELLLSMENSLGVTAKAFDVMTEHQRLFCSARILSDIRPVFSGTPETVSAAVIVHNLQIGFHQPASGDHEEIYIALDTDDLKALKDVIERAERKTTAMQTLLGKSELPYLQV